jgi:hypothetical protein
VTSTIPGTDPTRIDLTVRDPLAVTDARLIDPQGNVYPAVSIDRDRVSYGGSGGLQPSVGIGVAGGSSSHVSSGIGFGFPLFSSSGDAPGTFTESRVAFRIPDPTAYRSSWQHWKIHVDLAENGSSRVMEMLPPAPPNE